MNGHGANCKSSIIRFGGYPNLRYFTKKEDIDIMTDKANRIKVPIGVATGMKHKLDLDVLDKTTWGGFERVYNKNKLS